MNVKVNAAKLERFTILFPAQLEDHEIPTALRRIALEFLTRVIRKTPVDTGRARGGWLPFMQHENAAPSFPGAGAKRGAEESGFREDMHGPLKSITIINGVPYVPFLEYGRSQQAPQGMIRISLMEMSGMTGKEAQEAMKKALKKGGAS